MIGDLDALLAVHATAIGRAIAVVCRRAHLNDSERQELTQETWLHLLGNDGRAIRRFGGRSAAVTFFVRIATNVLVEIRRRRDGRWRPSARARRLGALACDLEALVVREGFTTHEAIETVHARRGASYHDLESLTEHLQTWWESGHTRARSAATPEAIDSCGPVLATTNPEQDLIAGELRRESARLAGVIFRAWTLLTVHERVALARHVAGPRPRTPRSEFAQASHVLCDVLATAGIRWPEVALVLHELDLDLGLPDLLEHEPIARDIESPAQMPAGREEKGREEKRREETETRRDAPAGAQHAVSAPRSPPADNPQAWRRIVRPTADLRGASR